MVPRIYVSLRDYIDVCIDFSRNVDLSETELNHQIAMAANLFFMSSLQACLLSAIRENRPVRTMYMSTFVNFDAAGYSVSLEPMTFELLVASVDSYIMDFYITM